MPRVYICQKDRESENYKKKIRAMILGRAKQLGYTQADLANELGITRPAITLSLKSGSLSLMQFIRLAKLLGLNGEDLTEIYER